MVRSEGGCLERCGDWCDRRWWVSGIRRVERVQWDACVAPWGWGCREPCVARSRAGSVCGLDVVLRHWPFTTAKFGLTSLQSQGFQCQSFPDSNVGVRDFPVIFSVYFEVWCWSQEILSHKLESLASGRGVERRWRPCVHARRGRFRRGDYEGGGAREGDAGWVYRCRAIRLAVDIHV